MAQVLNDVLVARDLTTGDAAQLKRCRSLTVSTATFTVTAIHYGMTLFFTYAGAVAVTLPAAAEPLGSWFRCVNANSNTTDVTCSSPVIDTLIAKADATADSVAFATTHRIASSAKFISNGSKWVAMNENGACTMTVNT